MSENVLLKARRLYKDFDKSGQKVQIIKDVSLEVFEEDCVAIIGASGAGKSTLLHLLGALDRPTQGEVLFGHPPKNLWSLSDEELSDFRNRKLGFVFQFHHLLPEFSALENVMMPALIAGQTKTEAKNHAHELLEFVGLKDRADHRPSELSGGEQQRIAIARAIMLKPALLLGDELTGNLDSENSRKVIDLILELNRTFKIATLIVTHDANVASRMKRVLTMKDGKFVSS